MRYPAHLLALSFVAACGSGPAADRSADKADAAVATALARPIMADARMQGAGNGDALAPAERPIQAIVPPGSADPAPISSPVTLAARAAAVTAKTGAFTGCDWKLRYSYGWAALLPADVPLPDDAQTLEAAGSEAAPCRLRVIRFATGAAPDAALARYRAVAQRGGFAIRVLDGDRAGLSASRRDGAAFTVIVDGSTSGSAVDLIVNRGR